MHSACTGTKMYKKHLLICLSISRRYYNIIFEYYTVLARLYFNPKSNPSHKRYDKKNQRTTHGRKTDNTICVIYVPTVSVQTMRFLNCLPSNESEAFVFNRNLCINILIYYTLVCTCIILIYYNVLLLLLCCSVMWRGRDCGRHSNVIM